MASELDRLRAESQAVLDAETERAALKAVPLVTSSRGAEQRHRDVRQRSETDVPLPNVAHMQTRPARMDRPEVDLRRLVAGFLRMAPDVAIVGEVRDREALALLLTLSSGVQGFTTIHAGSARQALSRLRFISQLSDTRSDLSLPALSALVSEAVDLVVHCARIDGVPRVTEVVAVEDLHVGAESVAFTTTPLFERPRRDRGLVWTGSFPVRSLRALELAGSDVRSLLHSPAESWARPAGQW